MSSTAKAYELYEHSKVKITDVDIEAMAVSLETAKEYGLSAYFEERGGYYMVTRYGQDVTECRDILELSDTTLAIANFIDVGKQHHKVI